mmetsp:Transcript_21955/g.39854  ORF Transcript_21955/g.39854 Transcript_21955/m.39854 type:complete len:392 (-) Transcript_21955:41-1216(-)
MTDYDALDAIFEDNDAESNEGKRPVGCSKNQDHDAKCDANDKPVVALSTDVKSNMMRWLQAEEAAYNSITGLHMSRCFLMPDLAVEGCLVSKAELDFFRKFGFLVKKGLLSPPKLEVIMQSVWDEIEQIPSTGQLTRSKPESWVDPGWETARLPWSGPYKGRAPVFRVKGQNELKLHAFGASEPLLDLVPHDTAVQSIAKLLLGENLKEVQRTRGVYALFPTKEGNKMLGPHIDKSAQQLNVCAYLDDIPARSGGFTVWPSSHSMIYPAMELESNFSPKAEVFAENLNQCLQRIVPMELVGSAGDVIFWHGRTVHSAGVHVGRSIRFAVFADFQLRAAEGDEGFLTAQEEEEIGQYEWFKDTKLYRCDRPPCQEDMFQHWAMRSDEPTAES